jgi:hypothetical protein
MRGTPVTPLGVNELIDSLKFFLNAERELIGHIGLRISSG